MLGYLVTTPTTTEKAPWSKASHKFSEVTLSRRSWNKNENFGWFFTSYLKISGLIHEKAAELFEKGSFFFWIRLFECREPKVHRSTPLGVDYFCLVKRNQPDVLVGFEHLNHCDESVLGLFFFQINLSNVNLLLHAESTRHKNKFKSKKSLWLQWRLETLIIKKPFQSHKFNFKTICSMEGSHLDSFSLTRKPLRQSATKELQFHKSQKDFQNWNVAIKIKYDTCNIDTDRIHASCTRSNHNRSQFVTSLEEGQS